MSPEVLTLPPSQSEEDVRHNQRITLSELQQAVREAMEAEGVTQAELSRRCEVTRQAIHRALQPELAEAGDHSLGSLLGLMLSKLTPYKAVKEEQVTYRLKRQA